MGWGGFADGYYTIDDIYGYGSATTDYAAINIHPPGVTQSITVTSPNGGEIWNLGGTYDVTWTSKGMTGNVGIKLFQNGASIGYVAVDVPVSAGTYSWTISEVIGVGPITPGTNYQIQIKQSGVAGDLSDAVFTILPLTDPTIAFSLSGE